MTERAPRPRSADGWPTSADWGATDTERPLVKRSPLLEEAIIPRVHDFPTEPPTHRVECAASAPLLVSLGTETFSDTFGQLGSLLPKHLKALSEGYSGPAGHEAATGLEGCAGQLCSTQTAPPPTTERAMFAVICSALALLPETA